MAVALAKAGMCFLADKVLRAQTLNRRLLGNQTVVAGVIYLRLAAMIERPILKWLALSTLIAISGAAQVVPGSVAASYPLPSLASCGLGAHTALLDESSFACDKDGSVLPDTVVGAGSVEFGISDGPLSDAGCVTVYLTGIPSLNWSEASVETRFIVSGETNGGRLSYSSSAGTSGYLGRESGNGSGTAGFLFPGASRSNLADAGAHSAANALAAEIARRGGIQSPVRNHGPPSRSQYQSAFISYSTQQEDVAMIIHRYLSGRGVRAWFAPTDLSPGETLRVSIDLAIQSKDRFLVLLSAASIASPWVEKEVETAFEQERRRNKRIIVPVRLDNSVFACECGWAADLRRNRHIADFTRWEDISERRKLLRALIRSLRIDS